MRQIALPATLLIAAVLALIAYTSTFIVTEREQAIQLRFGEIERVITEPGIYFKIPTNAVDTVQIIDKRLQTMEIDNNVVQVKDSRQYVVDAFTTFRVTNPRAFRESVSANLSIVQDRLRTRLDAALRRVYGTRSFDAALSDARAEMMREVTELVRPQAAELGIDIVELRIRRTELPENVLPQTFERMRSERLAEAAELRAEGKQESLRIRAEADRQATVLVAEANRDADILQGKGDAERNRLLAEAYALDPDFFAFYRSMQAYATALGADGTTMVMKPDTAFFRYFSDPKGIMPQSAPADIPGPMPALP